MDSTGTDWAVLYPTRGLFYGRILFEDWAIAYAKAYNNWLHDAFVKDNPRLRGVGLLPCRLSTKLSPNSADASGTWAW